MQNIKDLIDNIVPFGTNPNVTSENNIKELQKLLVAIYGAFLNLKTPEVDDDFDEDPTFEYETIKKNVQSNFPSFGWYHTISESHNILDKAEVFTGDAIDDLTDIILDLLKVQWRFQNTSEKDAIWYFQLLLRIHSEQHLVDLLKYIKDKES